jgi:hypothetical protein
VGAPKIDRRPRRDGVSKFYGEFFTHIFDPAPLRAKASDQVKDPHQGRIEQAIPRVPSTAAVWSWRKSFRLCSSQSRKASVTSTTVTINRTRAPSTSKAIWGVTNGMMSSSLGMTITAMHRAPGCGRIPRSSPNYTELGGDKLREASGMWGRLELITLDSTDQPFPLCPLLASARAALAELDEGTFTEGHELDRKTAKQVPKAMIGRRLSQEKAKRLLAKFE